MQSPKELNTSTERASFEAWAEREGFRLEPRGFMYRDEATDEAWRAWQARAALSERAAEQPARRLSEQWNDNEWRAYRCGQEDALAARTTPAASTTNPPTA